jgi:hypothetical protein
MKKSVTIARHKDSGCYLYNGQWWQDPPNLQSIEPSLCGRLRDIQYRGKHSEGIIDDNIYNPEDLDREGGEWNEDDDLVSDYEEVELDVPFFVVSYSNRKMDYSLQGNVGGYCTWYEKFNTERAAKHFIANLCDKYCY